MQMIPFNRLGSSNKDRISLAISGLDRPGVIAGCLKDLLESMDGVFNAYVGRFTEVVYVVYDSKKITADDLNRAVRSLGLQVEFTQYPSSERRSHNHAPR